MFLHITQNRCGRPLVSREVAVNLVREATTKEGLTIQSELDENLYETGPEVSDDEFKTPSIDRASFHGEWNCTLAPRSQYDWLIPARLPRHGENGLVSPSNTEFVRNCVALFKRSACRQAIGAASR